MSSNRLSRGLESYGKAGELYNGRGILSSTGDVIDDYLADEDERHDLSFLFVWEVERNRIERITLHPTRIEDWAIKRANETEWRFLMALRGAVSKSFPWRAVLVAVTVMVLTAGAWLWSAEVSPVYRNKGAVQAALVALVRTLAVTIGSRSYKEPANLTAAAEFIAERLASFGYDLIEQPYQARGVAVRNIVAERRGVEQPDRLIVIGAHYDSVVGSPGADDNASGAAVLLELARLHAATRFRKTVRFVGFTLEEPPFFRSRYMGSRVYARSLRERGEQVEAMLCLESVGYFSQEPGSQSFPWLVFWLRWRYPTTGNFITIVSNADSEPLQTEIRDALNAHMSLPVETYTGPWWIPGVDWSDHGSFWKEGYRAVMLTDTALFRNPHYHRSTDLPETLDYQAMTELVFGLAEALTALDARR